MRISDWSSDVCSSDLGSPQVSRLDAAGGVTVTRPDQSARGNYAVYDLNRRVITMIGGVTLTQGGNTVNGGRLTITLDTGRAVIDGAAMAGRSTGAAGHPTPPRGGLASRFPCAAPGGGTPAGLAKPHQPGRAAGRGYGWSCYEDP